MLVLLVAVTLGLRAALQRTIVRPISTLAETVEQVRSLADYQQRVPASGADEVARLGKTVVLVEPGRHLGGLTQLDSLSVDGARIGNAEYRRVTIDRAPRFAFPAFSSGRP